MTASETIWAVPDMDDVPRKHWDCGVWREGREDALDVHGEPVTEYTRSDLTIRRDNPTLQKVMERIAVQVSLLRLGCGGVQGRIDICCDRIESQLAALQELMGDQQ